MRRAPRWSSFVGPTATGVSLLAHLRVASRSVLDSLPALPWRLDGYVVHGEVRDVNDIPRVALACVRGAALDVAVRCAATVDAELIDTLERTGGGVCCI